MADRELSEAEKLDLYIEIHQAGQVAAFQPDLSQIERGMANKLLTVSANAQPGVEFFAELENQFLGPRSDNMTDRSKTRFHARYGRLKQ